MNRLTRFANVVKNNPKKSVLFASLTIYCANYVDGQYREELLRRQRCSSLSYLGREKLPENNSLYRVTVFLNHLAHQKRNYDSFNKNVGPLLHLSGLDVQMVYLDDDDEAKAYSSVIDPLSTDAILVAGDDNLFAKTVTGLLRRADFLSSRLWDIPLYVVPLGVWNTFAGRIYPEDSIVNWCYNFVKPLVFRSTQRRNVLEIRPITEDSQRAEVTEENARESEEYLQDSSAQCHLAPNNQKNPNSVFAATGLEWSCWRDVEYGGGGQSLSASKPSSHKKRIQNDWVFYPTQWFKRGGALFRHSLAWIRSPSSSSSPIILPSQSDEASVFFRSNDASSSPQPKKIKPVRRPLKKQAKLVFTPTCSGCSSCWQAKNRLSSKPQPSPRSASFLGRFLGFKEYSTANNAKSSNSRSQRDNELGTISPQNKVNPLCGTETTLILPSLSRIAFTLEGDNIRVNVSPAAGSLLAYLFQTFQSITAPAYYTTAPDDDVPLQISGKKETSFLCSRVNFYPSRTDGEFYWIDNDCFEACAVQLRILRNAINTLPVADVLTVP